MAHLVLEPALKQSLTAFVTDTWQVNVARDDTSGRRAGRERLAHDCVMQLASACRFLHAQGIIHRDMKPENVGVKGLNEPFQFYLLDMGHAIEAESSDDHCKGTVRYLAPEVLDLKYRRTASSPNYGPEVDVWALGLVGIELINAIRLKDDSHALQAAEEQRCRNDTLPIYSALKKMLRTRPSFRCSMADIVNILELN